MNKLTAAIAAALCCVITASAGVHAEVYLEKFTHQNITGIQDCYSGDELIEKDITRLPEVAMGISINNPVIRAYLKNDTDKNVTIKAEQYSKYGRLIKTDVFENVSVTSAGTNVGFRRVRNAESVKLYADDTYIGGINDDEAVHYINGIKYSAAPSDHQIYQRNSENSAQIAFSGKISPPEYSSPKKNSNENITLRNDVITVNFAENNSPAVIFDAEYDNDNVLQNVSIVNKPENENSVEIPASCKCSSEKIMVRESLESMKPIYDTVSFTYADSVTIKAVNTATGKKTVRTVRADSASLEFDTAVTLEAGLYDISVIYSGQENVFSDVGVGDIWVAAGQSNMTDMGAVTDNFSPDESDPVNDNMHIIFAEDTKWQKMTHPAGESRFFKAGVRTSPVTSFARIISADQGVPVGIVQSSAGGTNIYQWAKGINPADDTDGYLLDALKSCFDNMPSTDIKGILWYQGCNDTMSEQYAYDYENLQRVLFSQMREFFGENTPIITTQINDAKQPDENSSGYYDAWSYVKDVQRRNPELYENVYVVGTNALDIGDTIHNSAASNVKLGSDWAAAALNTVYGKTDITYLHPTINSVIIADEHTIKLEFKNAGSEGLFLRTDKKRLGITNGLVEIPLGDLRQEFTVRQGGGKTITSSNANKGAVLTITDAALQEDGKTVILTIEEELAGVVAVDCCCGKYFVPSLTDKAAGRSVLSFFNVIADWGENIASVEPLTYQASDTALLSEGEIAAESFPQTISENIPASTPSDKYMYLNGSSGMNAYPLMKFDLGGIDTSHIQSATLRIYTSGTETDRTGNITVTAADTVWDNTLTYPAYKSALCNTVQTFENVNTAQIFPIKAYSDIDITEYIRSLSAPRDTAFQISASYPAAALMYGKNSEYPPEIKIRQGRIMKIIYKNAADEPITGQSATISGTGSTEYPAKDFVTDENGEITVVLTEGNYKISTPDGQYFISENRFSVTEDGSLSYTLDTNTQITGLTETGGESVFAGTNTEKSAVMPHDTVNKAVNDAEMPVETPPVKKIKIMPSAAQ